jgi:hypothetical protein
VITTSSLELQLATINLAENGIKTIKTIVLMSKHQVKT